MPAALTTAQLYAAFTEPQVTALWDHWPTPDPSPDPVAEEITAACARVDAYCAGWAPAAALTTGWARDLAAWHVLKRLGLASEDHSKAYDRAITELEDLRAGKFPNVPRAATGQVSHGSRQKIV